MPELSYEKGIVLVRRRFRESGLIVDILSEKRGRVSLLFHGVLRSKDELLRESLEPFNIVDVSYYYKEGRSLQRGVKAEAVARFPKISADYSRYETASTMVRKLMAVLPAEQSDARLFAFIAETLFLLNDLRTDAFILDAIALRFSVGLAVLGGFVPMESLVEQFPDMRAITDPTYKPNGDDFLSLSSKKKNDIRQYIMEKTEG